MASIDLYNDFNEELDAQGRDSDQNAPDFENEGNEAGEKVDAKVKLVKLKRKIQTLNVERLKGPRGIVAVEDFFQSMKFKSKGYETQDLNEVMMRLEHWGHR